MTRVAARSRVLCAVVVAALALLATACVAQDPASDTRTAATTRPSGDCPRGKVYRQRIFVERATGEFDDVAVFIACKPDGDSKIVDTNAQSYEDLDDFLANNNLFSEDDMITLPAAFPSVDLPPGPIDMMTIPGHTASSSWVWWVAGGTVLALAGGGWFVWSRVVRRRARRTATDLDTGFDTGPPESPA